MSRLTIDLIAQTADPGSHVVSVVPGASVTVNVRNNDGTTGAAASVYQFADPTNNTTLSQPLTVDAAGRIPGWLNPGDYYVTVSAAGLATETIAYTVPSSGSTTIDPTQSALGVLKVVGPTNQTFAASTTTNIAITVPSWVEQFFNRVVVGLIIEHPDVSKVGAALWSGTPVDSVTNANLFTEGSFAAGTVNLGDPTRPTDPDAFAYFSDLAPKGTVVSSTSELDPVLFGPGFQWPPTGDFTQPTAGNYEPFNYPWTAGPDGYVDSYFNQIFAPGDMGAGGRRIGSGDPLVTFAGDTTENVTLILEETGGTGGTLVAVVLYLISAEFDAIRGWIEPPHSVTTLNVTDWGVLNDGVFKTNGSMTSGSAVLTTSAATFVPGDVGKMIAVSGALSTSLDHNTLVTTITAYTSATQVTLSLAANTTVSGAHFVYGTDNSGPMAQLVQAQRSFTSAPNPLYHYFFPPGTYMTTGAMTWSHGVFEGVGNDTILLMAGIHGAETGTTGAGSFLNLSRCIVRDLSIGMVWNFFNGLTTPPTPTSGFGCIRCTGATEVTRVGYQNFPTITNNTLQPPWTALTVPSGFPQNYVSHMAFYTQGDGISITGGEAIITDSELVNDDRLSLGLQGVTINYSNGTASGPFVLRNIICPGTRLKINGTGALAALNLRVTECQFSSIDVAAGVANFKIVNCETVDSLGSGITVAAGASDHYVISLNETNGRGVHDNGTGTNKVVANNI